MFRAIDSDLETGKCPYCGNISFKFKHRSVWMFICHDCQRYLPVSKLPQQEETTIKPTIDYTNILTLCKKVSELPSNHIAYMYCDKRKIPMDLVYYSDDFEKLASYAGQKVKSKPRLILPFFTKTGKLFALQGRALDNDELRYITIKFDESHAKIFGLERLNEDKDIVIVEGPIDSFFVKNCIAVAGSDGIPNKYLHQAVIAFDNEPWHKETVSKVKKSLESGFRTVIWPKDLPFKDINDMFLAGLDVNQIISENTYQGLIGQLKFNEWKKI